VPTSAKASAACPVACCRQWPLNSGQQPRGAHPATRILIAAVCLGTVRLQGGEALQGALVVGAEGVRSPVAAQLGVRPQNYAGYSAYRC
jgi:2-polyprenyl-6-methoxyphenol hydroxylase-like FAD-dependent oxidoreductase